MTCFIVIPDTKWKEKVEAVDMVTLTKLKNNNIIIFIRNCMLKIDKVYSNLTLHLMCQSFYFKCVQFYAYFFILTILLKMK